MRQVYWEEEKTFKKLHANYYTLTDRIRGQIRFRCNFRNSRTIFVYSYYSEVILCSGDKVRHFECGIFNICFHGSPSLAINFSLLNNIMGDVAASITVRWGPRKVARRHCNVNSLKTNNRSRCICFKNNIIK